MTMILGRLRRLVWAAFVAHKYVRVPDKAKMPTSCWCTVLGHPKYEAHPMGLVRRIDSWRVLKCTTHSTGQVVVRLFDEPGVVPVTTTLAYVICLTFHGPRPSLKHCALHLDRNPENNRASNLKWWPMGSWNTRRKA